jgi:hypothetical protein
VASLEDSRSFGRLVAAEEQSRNFYQAQRGAFLGDGAVCNGSIQRGYFPHFEPIKDFLHVLCYLYLAARAAGSHDQGRWSIYLGWMLACWQGRVGDVIEQLQRWQELLGVPPPREEMPETDPRRLVAEALTYLQITSNGWITRATGAKACRVPAGAVAVDTILATRTDQPHQAPGLAAAFGGRRRLLFLGKRPAGSAGDAASARSCGKAVTTTGASPRLTWGTGSN